MSEEMVYLSADDVAAVAPSMTEVLDALESMFREKAQGTVEMPPKPGIHPVDGAFIHAMPAYIPGLDAAGIKWVSAYPENPKHGLPQIACLILVNDTDTGLVTAILDGAWVTAARTAAASMLAARYFARSDAEVIGILGCGVQARSHLEAFAEAFPVRSVYAYDVNPQAANRFAEEMTTERNLSIRVVDAPRDAVEPADIMITAGSITRPPHAVIQPDWLSPGAFAASVDFASSWSREAIRQFDRIVTDDLPQFATYRSAGYLEGMPDPDTELAWLITGTSARRNGPDERTLCCNLGLAAADMAVAPLVVRRAIERGIGHRLPR